MKTDLHLLFVKEKGLEAFEYFTKLFNELKYVGVSSKNDTHRWFDDKGELLFVFDPSDGIFSSSHDLWKRIEETFDLEYDDVQAIVIQKFEEKYAIEIIATHLKTFIIYEDYENINGLD